MAKCSVTVKCCLDTHMERSYSTLHVITIAFELSSMRLLISQISHCISVDVIKFHIFKLTAFKGSKFLFFNHFKSS